LIASTADNYVIAGVKVLGFIQYTDSNNSLSYQLFQRTIGPIIIEVDAQLFSFAFFQLINSDVGRSQQLQSYSLLERSPSSASNNTDSLTLTKQISKQNYFIPGDIITTKITISNEGDERQFYVVEDEIPTGTVFLSDSVQISVNNDSEITHDLYLTGIHFFFPILPAGTTEITYQLQVDSIKNSYSGECKLWGMYDDININSQSVVLENIPRKYYTNHSIYQDLIKPSFSNIRIIQNEISPRIELKIQLRATDNNGISKIRIIFSQISGWRAQTLYSMQDQEEFSYTLADFKNVDSNVKVFFEIYDVYGNIATTNIRTIKVIEVIPYLIIGAIVCFSIGIASLISFLSKRMEEKKRENQDKLIEKSKPKLSFLDANEQNNEE